MDISQLLKKTEPCDLICIGRCCLQGGQLCDIKCLYRGTEFSASESWQLIASLGTETRSNEPEEANLLGLVKTLKT